MPLPSGKSVGSDPTLKYLIGRCFIGTVLVAASERGVCMIALGDDPGLLVRDACSGFGSLIISGVGDPRVEALHATVLDVVEGGELPPELPLDLCGTPFQQRVWQMLLTIPAGSTASYAALAQRMGAPGAARAVARACAANPLAVVIPCHRVVRSDGALSGYRWGVARKRALIEREARQARCQRVPPSTRAVASAGGLALG